MSTKTISVRSIPEDLWQLARIEAMKRGMSMPELVITALRQIVAPKGQKQ